MPDYLSKEEVKQWRSSLEKITLEEYAARLGKEIEEDKPTNDVVDIVLKSQSTMSKIEDSSIVRSEKITSIAQRSFAREREISPSPFSVSVGEAKKQVASKKIEKSEVKEEKAKKSEAVKTSKASVIVDSEPKSLREEVQFVFNKVLTEREQLVFDHFASNQDKIVYAKDLAKLLDLPRDYVYKYIKNLRTKIDGDKLQNAENGGYVLSV